VTGVNILPLVGNGITKTALKAFTRGALKKIKLRKKYVEV
jgi:hypothetical protein